MRNAIAIAILSISASVFAAGDHVLGNISDLRWEQGAGNNVLAVWGSVPWWQSLPSGLICVLDGNDAGATEGRWDDLSGYGNHYALNGGVVKEDDGVQFDGSSGWAEDTHMITTNLTETTVICVADVQRIATYNFIFVKHGDGGFEDRFQFYTADDGIYVWCNNTSVGLPSSSGTGDILGAFRWDGETAYLGCGSASTSGIPDPLFHLNAEIPVRLGKFADYYALVKVRCFVVWNRCLTGSDYTSATNIINQRYPGGIR